MYYPLAVILGKSVLVQDDQSEKRDVEGRDVTSPEAMERLRDRTDELELIISSLTIFALLTIPGWLFGKVSAIYTHLSTSLAIASTLSMTLVAGVCYGLAACFILHLMARAYWVGLIGLRTVFPDGINWEKTPGIGPITRTYWRQTLPSLDTVIQRTDRLASSLFAVISMLTLSVLWFGVILVTTLVVSGAIGARFGYTNLGIGVGSLILLAVFLGVPILVYLLDVLLASRVPRLRESKFFAGLVRSSRRLVGLAYPQRLVLPVQLTLQSNTRPIAVYIALSLSIIVIVVIGNIRAAAWTNFTLSGEFSYLNAAQVQTGFRSTYYEDMQSPIDGTRAWPRIDSFRQSGSFARVFLPYQPLRDNLILDELCDSTEEPADRTACLRKVWSVSVNDQAVPMTNFLPSERTDIRMRGLIGLVPLNGLEPGLRSIVVIWNPSETGEAAALDDRYLQPSIRYEIPIAFAPDFEMSLD